MPGSPSVLIISRTHSEPTRKDIWRGDAATREHLLSGHKRLAGNPALRGAERHHPERYHHINFVGLLLTSRSRWRARPPPGNGDICEYWLNPSKPPLPPSQWRRSQHLIGCDAEAGFVVPEPSSVSVDLRYREVDLTGPLASLIFARASDFLRIEVRLLADIAEFQLG